MSTSLLSPVTRRGPVALVTLLLATAMAHAAALQASPPAPNLTPPPPRADGPRVKLRQQRPALDPGAPVTASGRVARWLQNPNGDVDGLLLEDGTQIAVPPSQSARLLQSVKLRDTVQVTGLRGRDAGQTGPGVLRATQVRTSAGATLVLADGDPGEAAPLPPDPREPSALTPMNASGRITAQLHGVRGEVNGVLLADGTVVRFPPHVGADMAPALKVGGNLYARGYGTRNALGGAFEATRLGSTEASARDVFSPLARAGDPEMPRRGPADESGNTPMPSVPPVPPAAPGATEPR